MHIQTTVPFILYFIPLLALLLFFVPSLKTAFASQHIKEGEGHWAFSIGRLILSVLVFVIPLAFDKDVPEVAGDLRWYLMHFFAFILLILFFVYQASLSAKEAFSKTTKVKVFLSFPVLMAFFILMLGALTLLWSINLPTSFWFFKHLFAYVILFSAFIYLRDEKWYRSLLWVVALGIFFNGFLGILQFLNITDAKIASFLPFVDHVYFVDYFRQSAPPAGTLSNKNLTASYLVLTLPVTLYLLFTASKRRSQAFAAVCFALGGTLLMYTRSRGSWLSAIAALIFLSVWFLIHKEQRTVLLESFSRCRAFFFAASLAFIVGLSQISSKLPQGFHSIHKGIVQQAESVLNMGENDLGARYAYNLNGLAIIKENPFGTGLSTFHTIYPKYNRALIETPYYGYNIGARPRRAHNDLLQAFVELGVLGGFSYIALFVSMLVMSWKIARCKKGKAHQKMLSLALVTGITGFAVNALGDFPLQMPTAPFFLWMFMGMLTALYLHVVQPKLYVLTLPKFIKHPLFYGVLITLTAAAFVFVTYDNVLRRESTVYLKPAMSLSYGGVNNDYTYMYIQKAYELYPNNSRTLEIRAVVTSAHGKNKPHHIQLSLMDKVNALTDHLKYDPYAQNTLVNTAYQYMQSAQNYLLASKKEKEDIKRKEYYKKAQRNVAYAEYYAKRAVEVASQNPHAYNILGTTYLAQAKFEEAIKWFNQALVFDPNFSPALNSKQKAESFLKKSYK